jgi:hypothetical protein
MSDTPHGLGQVSDCRSFVDRIFDFQADELSEAERESFSEHRDRCPPCARRLEVEDGLLRAVRVRLSPEPPPPQLELRVREALRREAPAPDGASWARRLPWLVPLAASVLLALVVGPPVARRLAAQRASAAPFAALVTVVDLECEREGRSLAAQIRCTDPYHLNAVRAEDGRIWNLGLDRREARRIVVDRTMRGHRLRVRGELFQSLATLQLDGYEDLGPARELAARLPRPQP